MFNLMVTASDDAWEEGAYIWHVSRILEHTEDEVREPLRGLSANALKKLAKLPTLFMYERDVGGVPRVGTIRHIQRRGMDIRVIFEFDERVPPLTPEAIEKMEWELSLDNFEFSRTHWAVKRGDLYEILREAGHLSESQGRPMNTAVQPVLAEDRPPEIEVEPTKVFLVHGRDESAKYAVARFLETRVGLDVVILAERPNQGRSILTKFEKEAEGASFAVILMTPDDFGYLRSELSQSDNSVQEPKARPRQNVIFELGFFIGRLGVDRVCALVSPGVERPSDYDGIVYVQLDNQDGWQKKLVTELHAADVPVSSSWWKD